VLLEKEFLATEDRKGFEHRPIQQLNLKITPWLLAIFSDSGLNRYRCGVQK
jgi:hypothetical protein